MQWAPVPLESGVSECAGLPSSPACQGFNDGLTLWLVGIPGVVLWFVLAACATAGIARMGSGRNAAWLAAVWCLPIIGAIAWYGYRLTARLRRLVATDQLGPNPRDRI